MSDPGIQALMLQMVSSTSTLAYHEIMALSEIARVLSASYRFASSESGAGLVYTSILLSLCWHTSCSFARLFRLECSIKGAVTR